MPAGITISFCINENNFPLATTIFVTDEYLFQLKFPLFGNESSLGITRNNKFSIAIVIIFHNNWNEYCAMSNEKFRFIYK